MKKRQRTVNAEQEVVSDDSATNPPYVPGIDISGTAALPDLTTTTRVAGIFRSTPNLPRSIINFTDNSYVSQPNVQTISSASNVSCSAVAVMREVSASSVAEDKVFDLNQPDTIAIGHSNVSISTLVAEIKALRLS